MSGTSPTVLQRSIAFEMRRLRQAAGMTQVQAAEASGYTDGAINHLEKRNRKPQKPMVFALLRAYGYEDLIPEMDENLRLMRRPNWWANRPASAVPTGFGVYLGLEDGASSLDWWEPMVVPGLMQTEEYARRMIAPDPYGIDPQKLTDAVQLRLRRKEILTRSEQPVSVWAVITEFALMNVDGPVEVKRAQMDHLLELVRLPNVQLQVIPTGTNVVSGSRGPFTVLHFDQPEDPGAVYIETQQRAVWFESHEDIQAFQEVMSHLQAGASGTRESAALIEKHRKEASK